MTEKEALFARNDELVILECESRHSFSAFILITQFSREPRVIITRTVLFNTDLKVFSFSCHREDPVALSKLHNTTNF